MLLLNNLSLLLALPAFFSPALAGKHRKYADTVFRNGAIYSLDRKSSKYEAMAVKDGVISFLGTDKCAKDFIGPKTHVFDLKGRMAMPGLVDAHMHLLGGGASLLKCNLNYQPLTLEDVLKHVQGCLDADSGKTDSDWLEVVNMDFYHLIDVTGGVTKKQLDTLNTKRPIILHSADRHTHWINSAALKASNITASTPNPAGGVIERLPGSKEPSGVIQDAAANLLTGPAPPTAAEDVEFAEAALKLLREEGITTFQEASTDDRTGAAFKAVKQKGQLSARGFYDWRIDAPSSKAGVKPMVKTVQGAIKRWHDPKKLGPAPSLKLQAVKIMTDGVILYPANTGALIEPYFMPSENGTVWEPDPNQRPDPYWSTEILAATFMELIPKGIDAQIHVDGDLAVRSALNAVEAFRKKYGNKYDYRLGFAHNEVTDPKDWPRFSKLKVDPIMSFQWSQASSVWIPNTLKSMGPVRSKHLEAWGELARFGSRIVYGSDWPIDPLDEWLAIKAGVTRSGDPTNPNSPASLGAPYDGPGLPGLSLSREQAIRAITIEAARFLRADKHIGSLEVGKLADVIILKANYFKVPDSHIARQKTLLTMVGGEVLYIADGVDFKNGVKAKFPNDDELGKKLHKKNLGGVQGRSLSSEGHQAVRRLSVRNVCDHSTPDMHQNLRREFHHELR